MKRLVDTEIDIRTCALTQLLEFAADTPAKLSVAAYRAIGDRVRDRNNDIKKQAMIGLAKCYHRHVAAYLQPLVSESNVFGNGTDRELASSSSSSSSSSTSSKRKSTSSRRDSNSSVNSISSSPQQLGMYRFDDEYQFNHYMSHIPIAHMERFAHVPSLIINCWGYTDIGFRHLVLQLLQEHILPKKFVSTHDDVINAIVDDDLHFGDGYGHGRESSKSNSSLKPPHIAISDEELNGRRASAFLLMFSRLSSNDRSALGTILGAKTKVRVELDSYMKARSRLQTLLQLEQSKAGNTRDSGVSINSMSSEALADELDEAELNVKKCLN